MCEFPPSFRKIFHKCVQFPFFSQNLYRTLPLQMSRNIKSLNLCSVFDGFPKYWGDVTMDRPPTSDLGGLSLRPSLSLYLWVLNVSNFVCLVLNGEGQ